MLEPIDRDPKPVRLEYAPAPVPGEAPRGRLCWILLIISWPPFACGVVSSLAVAKSGIPELVANHRAAGLAFMGLGCLLSTISFLGFVLSRNALAAIFAIIALISQICMALCSGGFPF